jgi:hypothetical protein
MKKISFILMILLFAGQIHAEMIKVTGQVINKKDATPIEYANVILQANDSTFISGGTTDEKGHFAIDVKETGNYRLVASCIGYDSQTIPLNDFTRSKNVGNIQLDESSISLGEGVTVTATSVIHKYDRSISFPNGKQIEKSNNGLSLLQNMMLPEISVNPLQKTIATVDNTSLQLRINDVKATINEVNALSPKDIIRVECINNPGLRYDNVGKVLNFIVRHNDSGGNLGLDTQSDFNWKFNNTSAYAKVNKGKSEYNINYDLYHRRFNHMWRDYEQTYNFADGTSEKRVETGMPGDYYEERHSIYLGYNFQQPEKYTINIKPGIEIYRSPKTNFNSMISSSLNNLSLDMIHDYTNQYTTTPSLDLYFARYFKHKQMLMFNVVGTYSRDHYRSSYTQFYRDSVTGDYRTNVMGHKYSIISEGLYEKELKGGRIDIGVKHTQSHSNNDYLGTTNYNTKMNEANTYMYGEFTSSLKKFTYTVGFGAVRNHFKQESESSYTTWQIRPRLTLGYKFSDHFQMRLNSSLENYSPDLSNLSAVEQTTNSREISKGNPDLKPYYRFSNRLRLEGNIGTLTAILQNGIDYDNKPIMESTYMRGNDLFIRTYENQDSWTRYYSTLTLRTGMLWKFLQLNATGGFNRFASNGKTYHHNYTCWNYNFTANLMYHNWTLTNILMRSNDWLRGESMNGGEHLHVMLLGYKWKDLNIGVGITNPFIDNYHNDSWNRNQYANYKSSLYFKESSRLVAITLSWGLNFGKKYKADQKRLENSDSGSSIMKR